MKKVGLITIHVGANFGSNLQTIATVEVLKRLGYDTIVINYIPPRVTYKRYFKDSFRNIRLLPGRIAYFPSFCRNNLIYNGTNFIF